MTSVQNINVRSVDQAKKTNIGIFLTDGTRAKIGKSQKRSIIRRLNRNADPRSFGISLITLQRWVKKDLNEQIPAIPTIPNMTVKNGQNVQKQDYTVFLGKERADMVRKLKGENPKMTQAQLAKMFACGKTTIGDILKNKVFAD